MGFGLLGERLNHSYSPLIHSFWGNYSYELFEVQPDALEKFLTLGEFDGLNVTIPYKKTVIPYCDELSPTAQLLGAVNTIIRRADGHLLGHNTDYYGFSSMLDRCGCPVAGEKVLVLGSGGASATVVAVLRKQKARPIVISRTGADNYDNVTQHTDAAMIVNTTPVGMYPNVGVSPVELGAFPKLKAVLDVVYNPSRTQLLMEAERRGLITENGLWMLVAQAKESAEWFTGLTIDDQQVQHVYDHLRKMTGNTILIGMPGSGKSTVGKLLAEALSRPFVDADVKIMEEAGKSIPEIFSQDGESVFRQLEAKVLADIGKKSGLVIATGGGCVTRDENYASLHQNGTIYWLQRDLQSLPTVGRPLSNAGHLEAMYQKRHHLYARFADHIISNDTTPDDAVRKILALEETV